MGKYDITPFWSVYDSFDESKHKRDKNGRFASNQSVSINSNDMYNRLKKLKSERPKEDQWRVDLHDEVDYKNMKSYKVNNSLYAVKEDGDIVSVCKDLNDTHFSGKELMQKAVESGGSKLDSYGGNDGFYLRCGFRPIAACKGDEQMELDNGKPKELPTEDVIFYIYDKDYKPSKEQLDKSKNKNGRITLELLKKQGMYFDGGDGYDKAMNMRNKYKKGE